MKDLQPLVECVPNFSEGRDRTKIASIVGAVERSGVTLLHVDSSYDANRTVLTFVGSPLTVFEGARALIAAAQVEIDMSNQSGAHPRVGAVDVCPFVPLRGITLDELNRQVEEFASSVAADFELPTYLYAYSARAESRRLLSDIRRGEYEGLSEKLAQPQWKPDFGPSVPHPRLGALVCGVRDILVAFNVNLLDAPVAVARRIASRVRQYGPWIKAIGWDMPEYGCTQISMNLLRFWEFGIYDAFEACEVEAEYHDIQISGSELVGLVPLTALDSVGRRIVDLSNAPQDQYLVAAERYLGLSSVRPFERKEQVLELALGLPTPLTFPLGS